MKKKKLSFLISLAVATNLTIPAFASTVDCAVVDVTVPYNSVTLADGGTSDINFTITVKGKQDGTSTFQIYRDWTLINGIFEGSNPETYTVNPRAGNDPDLIINRTGKLTVGDKQSEGTYTLQANAINITNTNQTGAKLNVGSPSNYGVTVDNPEILLSITAPADVNNFEATGVLTPVQIGIPTYSGGNGSIIVTNNAPAEGFGLGTTDVVWTATDANGNKSTAIQKVTIVDTKVDSLTAPQDVTKEATAFNTPLISEELGTATASDIFGIKSITNNAPAEGFGLGTTDVAWTAIDNNGNLKTATQKVTIVDTKVDSLTAPQDVTKEATAFNTPLTSKELGTVTASDIFGMKSITNNAPAEGFGLGTTDVVWTATDNNGNVKTATQKVTIVDTIAPTINSVSSNPDQSGWTNKDVTLTVDATDSGSGIAAEGGYSFDGGNTWQNSNTKVVNANGTYSIKVKDAAGNVATTTFDVKNIDKVAPTITVEDNGTYLLNQNVTWSAKDDLSGLAPGSAASGTIDTSQIGKRTQTITAIDKAGNTKEVTISYTVKYSFSGILEPINVNGSSVFKAGSTVPVKFTLKDYLGAYVTTANAKISYAKFSESVFGNDFEAVSTSAANIGNAFRYDPTSNQYVFNMSTKGLTAGTYLLTITLDDGNSYSVQISLK